MAALHPTFLSDVLQSIPHALERPRPQGTLAATHWAGLLLNLVLHPTQWHKLGIAVQWAKWVEWEGGLDFKSSIRTPGILYLQNPLHPFALNNLLNQLDFALVDIDTLVGCVDTGDWMSLLKETDGDDPKIREQAGQTLEQLCLLAFYLRQGLSSLTTSAGSIARVDAGEMDPKETEDDRLIQDVVSRILKAGEKNRMWHQAFSEHALRLTAQQDPRNPLLPSKLSVILNELLEMIRLGKIYEARWADPNVSNNLSDAQFQQLGKLLSTSFFTIMEFADVSLFLPAENTVFLSKFAAQLPASWFSDDFLRTTIGMAKKFITTEQEDKVRIPLQIQSLVAISTLWSFWMRKTGSADANVLGQELIELMAQILAIPSMFTGYESKGLLGACFSGLAMGLDKWSGLMEPKIVEGLVEGLQRGRVSAQDSDLEGIQASLATVLRSPIMEQNSEPIQKLVVALLQSFYGTTSLAAPLPVNNIDELFQILRLFQFVVTQRAGLVPVKDEDDKKKKKRRNRKPKQAVNLKDAVWFTGLVHGVQDTSTENAVSGLLAVAGILRAIQHGEDEPPKVDAESLTLIQDLFVTKLTVFIDALKGSEEKSLLLESQTQACLVFASSQVIPYLPSCKLGPMERALLVDLFVDFMLQPNEGVVPVNEMLRVVSYEQSKERNRLPLNGQAHQELTMVVKGPLFSEMGRTARTVATLIEGMDDWRHIEAVLQKMHSFAINVHVDWSRCGLSQADSFVERKDDQGGLDPETAKSMGMLFQMFKTVLFAYTMIFGSVVEKSTSEPVPAGLIAQLDYMILDSYAYLFFVTYKLGPGGFQAYEDLITSILARMVVVEGQHQLVQGNKDSDATGNNHILLNKTLRAMMPQAELGFHDPVMESRTLFFMNLLERVMIAIDEQFLEDQILPMVYPYLLKNDQRDLFESAHSAIMAVFLTKKRIAKNVAPFYSNLLLQHFPDQINIDQLRAAFTTMIRSLSETEDALAWLCVERLLEKIHQYDDDLAEAQVQAEQQAEAVQAIKKMQLEQEKEEALVEVATSVHQNLNPQESASHLPSLGTTISSTGPVSSLNTPLTTAMTSLERQKERGQILLALFDQLSSVNLVFVETLGQKIRELLVKEQSPVGRKALLKCLLDVIGGPAVDQTKRDWAVKWYLGLVNEFGHDQDRRSSATAGADAPASG
ncbi:hypothetical protein BG011_006468 [Mortierella polycephala]|uniref:Uncharacterized protein n=1 Tax=Mortierella polycephala TaxID=41804 RepID=A0A9P6QBE1_9FUNG|nr:hypothetical protein BG011_006468 [Mortierella polycephala]